MPERKNRKPMLGHALRYANEGARGKETQSLSGADFTQYQEDGVDYIAALLKGYENPPPGVTPPPGTFYNKYFPSHNLAMPQPLFAGQIMYEDGSPATLEQYSQDIAAFLMWAAEPRLVQRKRIGFQVMIYLIVLGGLLYLTKKKVWRAVEQPA